MQTGAAIMENSMEFSQKIKNGTVLLPSNSTSGNISEETQNTISKEYMHPYVYCSVIYNSQDLEAAQVSISKCVDKKAVVHLYSGILLGCKKRTLPFVTTWMNLESIMLSEINQLDFFFRVIDLNLLFYCCIE